MLGIRDTADRHPTLSVSGLRKSYSNQSALNGVDVEARAGEVVGLLGPNGAGKTTFASIVAGLVKPDGGSVLVEGVDALRHPRGPTFHRLHASDDWRLRGTDR